MWVIKVPTENDMVYLNPYIVMNDHSYDGNHINGIIDLTYKEIGVGQSFLKWALWARWIDYNIDEQISNDGIAGNGRIKVYQCIDLPKFNLNTVFRYVDFSFPLIFFLSFHSGLLCSSDVTCLFLT